MSGYTPSLRRSEASASGNTETTTTDPGKAEVMADKSGSAEAEDDSTSNNALSPALLVFDGKVTWQQMVPEWTTRSLKAQQRPASRSQLEACGGDEALRCSFVKDSCPRAACDEEPQGEGGVACEGNVG